MAFLRKSDDEDRFKTDIDTAIDKQTRLLEEIKSRILNLQSRMSLVEEKVSVLGRDVLELKNDVNARIPSKLLSEDKFLSELQGSDEIVDRILNEMKGMVGTRSARDIIAEKVGEDNKPSIVESKRIEKITSVLLQQGKLSSSQLSKMLGLSRTRCNEYFKQMESLGLVDSIMIGKEKFYILK